MQDLQSTSGEGKTRPGIPNSMLTLWQCDELRPVCKNCTKRGVQCEFFNKEIGSSAARKIEVHSLLSGTIAAAHPSPCTPNPRHDVPPALDLDLLNLALMHNFSTSTYTTFSATTSSQTVWREIVPRLSFSHPVLLHAVLANSALQLSIISPAYSKRYQLVAADHYNSASVALRNSLPPALNAEGALFLASCLIATYVFASPTFRQGTPQEPGALTWFPLLRGVRTVLEGCWESLKGSELDPLLHVKPQPPAPPQALPIKCLPELPLDIEALYETVEDPEVRQIYAEAIGTLRKAWAFTAHSDFRIASAFFWPYTVSEGFLKLLLRKCPRALVLLALYYTMFSGLEDVWWIRGVARKELAIIEGLVDREWGERWLGWARTVAGEKR